MKLKYKGIYKSEEQLPKGVLPDKAVKFKEPKTMEALTLSTIPASILCVIFVCLFMVGSRFLHGEVRITSTPLGVVSLITGFIACFLALIPHEILHALAFGKNATVEMFIDPKNFALFVTSVVSITKRRFILMSLFPNLVFGWIPFMVWFALPHHEVVSNFLLTFSSLSILVGVGDYMNIFNAIRQMPKGSMHQHSGFNSYWYMPSMT